MSKPPSDYTPRPMSNGTTYALGGVALALIALIVFFAFRWGAGDAEVRNDGYGSVHNTAVTAAVQSDGGVRLGLPDAPKTLEIYEDPMCPGCGSLEHLYGQEIAQKIDEGKLAVRYRFVNFLDSKSDSGDYSTRAAAALQCVGDTGSGVTYSKFHDALLNTRQPEEGSGLTDDELAGIATESGAPQSAHDCITTGARTDQARQQATAAVEDLKTALDGDAATPSVFDVATKLDTQNQEWVQQVAP
ncbi:DsbA family protein [Nocardia carnea]|uniref:Thioredoxin domain-containing protein n=1 Tax=Nocardia carnea TaxID=37328 RepID=A0ABW7TTQ4_9NOCA|nr:thioredoxin domain-containing protein [Nocardia carnea]